MQNIQKSGFLNIENKLYTLQDQFDGELSFYATDGKSEIAVNENKVVEAGSCIKSFILLEYFRQKIANEEILIYDEHRHRTLGSGIAGFMLNGTPYYAINLAKQMIVISDNVATNMIIERLGIDQINGTIQKNFPNTKLLADKLDFDIYREVGTTTAYEYASLFQKILLNDNIDLDEERCKEMIEIFSRQKYRTLLEYSISPDLLDEMGEENAELIAMATKSGAFGSKKKNIPSVRNDGGIIFTKYGNFIASIFTKHNTDYRYYDHHPGFAAGGEAFRSVLDPFLENKGSFLTEEETQYVSEREPLGYVRTLKKGI
ncbi:MAG: serine hydrolase [Mollicutes bacterium]|nr:serine hydrolase [Mollicutes bacterium]